MNITPVIIVKNGAQTIAKTLSALAPFSEVIVYDNGSTDGTQQIVSEFTNTKLVDGKFDGFGSTKNRAANLATHDWILILDCDEVIDDELVQALQITPLDARTIYVLNFFTYYKQTKIRYCGWSNQKIKRLYNRLNTRHNENLVHESIIDTDMKKTELPGNVHHYSYASLSDFIIKIDRYSTLFAEQNVGKRRSNPVKAIFNASFTFIKSYIFKLGFLDGAAGLIVCYSHMCGNFYKYMKLYEANMREQATKKLER